VEVLVAVEALEDELLEESLEPMRKFPADLIFFNILLGREVDPPDVESVLSLELDDEPIRKILVSG